ncbi:FIP1[III]-LIKE PROTEIN [Salix viminalis]|uniref:FIP1[III]-LIKE PROTEIN n=1 Tax=Salix viminalis TaxID=40686 RepID=A0A9Q0ZQF8_SALVM|nr:FIP1[III]-LIKE PROTEIN [Salix viminalis]
MEDDDEFGDLYTDVLRPFSSSSSSTPQPAQPLSAPSFLHRPIDINDAVKDDDEEILHGNPPAPSNQNSFQTTSFSAPQVRVLGDAKSPIKGSIGEDSEVNFDIEEVNTGFLEDSGPIIPGLMEDDSRKMEASAEISGGDGDWEGEEDSDSEDDLQIVLNDDIHPVGTMGIDREIGDDDDDDEDGDPLVIVGDGDGPNQAMEEQDWGVSEDGVAAAGGGAEGERKEGGETVGKGNAVVGPKIGYSNHVYHHHPFHSQFKYVRPGAAPMPAATSVGPGGTPGQVRPPMNMGAIAGRGRGDWRPVGIKGAPQKNFHAGFGGSAWGAGRGSGNGLEFTLPSHKTIFDVDIDGFEEKPWKYPGVDISDYFNFGLNEESWKDYCKQLEQYRLETTMQSKIRVYESGRAEQDYDPDLPPELAAATGFHAPANNSNAGKLDSGQSDLIKGSARMRPQIPTGRAIQVETGYGERIPSIEGRAPRVRDSDAIIEIVCQDSLDDSSPRDGVQDGAHNDPQKDDLRGSDASEDDMEQTENEYAGDFPQAYNGQKGGRRTPYMNSSHNMPEGDVLPFHPKAPAPYRQTGSRGHPPSNPGRDFDTPREERRMQGRSCDSSPHLTPSQNTRDKKFLNDVEEESTESMDDKLSPRISSPIVVRDARELSSEEKDDAEPLQAEGSSRLGRNEMTENEETTNDKDGNVHHSTRKQKVSSHIEQPALQQLDDEGDSMAARSSENSKDYQKWQDGVEEEVVQDRRSTRPGSIRQHLDENEQNFQRKDRDVRREMERNRAVIRGREDSYPHRDLDSSVPHHLHMKRESYDKRKERENPDISWQQRDEDPHSRKHKTEDRKRERGDEMGSRNRGKTRETERSDKDEYLHSRKQLENGSYRIHHDKDGSSRHRERDDNLKSRFEMVDDHQSKRRKDEEYVKREYAEKEEILHGHRENTSRRRHERDDQQRIRDNLDGYHSVKHKDEVWLQRERGERQREREREELYRVKQSNEENLPKREREEGRASVRSGRVVDDKAWAGHAWGKDEYKVSDKEYQLKDTVRNSEHQKRRDRMEDESLSRHRGRDDVYARGSQFSNEERRSRQERSSTRVDRTVDTSDNQRVAEKKHKENPRKNKESESGDHGTLGPSKRNQDDLNGHSDEVVLKRSREPGSKEAEMQRNSSKRIKKDASSDDEQQDSRRGRSKLERWTSHKERDYNVSKSSASLKFKEGDRNNNGGSLQSSKLSDEPPKKVEIVEKRTKVDTVEKHSTGEEKDDVDAENKDSDTKPENKDSDTKPSEDRHSDTVEKLKKRSERFKLPMPSEKDVFSIKKIESEAPAFCQT